MFSCAGICNYESIRNLAFSNVVQVPSIQSSQFSLMIKTTQGLLGYSEAIDGVPRVSSALGQSQFQRPHPAHSWQHRCEGWVESKRASKADSDLAYSCFWTRLKMSVIVTSQNWRRDLWILEIINYPIVKNLIVSRDAILTLKFRSWLNIQTITLLHSKCRY